MTAKYRFFFSVHIMLMKLNHILGHEFKTYKLHCLRRTELNEKFVVEIELEKS